MRLVVKLICLIFVLTFTLTSCAVTHSSYVQHIDLNTAPKNENSVEYLTQIPERSVYKFGTISAWGNGFSNFNHVIKEAKKKAAEVGGDFIYVENSGVEARTFYTPGHSSYQAYGNASAQGYGNANSYSANGHSTYQANGYSTGPTMHTTYFPWANFAVGVYTPARLGIKYEGYVVMGFSLNCDADKAGVQIGDTLLGVDGYDINDQALVHHTMKRRPGDKVVLTFLRDGKRVEFTVTALKN